jgi:hypothetical protein
VQITENKGKQKRFSLLFKALFASPVFPSFLLLLQFLLLICYPVVAHPQKIVNLYWVSPPCQKGSNNTRFILPLSVTLRKKAIKNGRHSLYLDYYLEGERKYEFLKQYIFKRPKDEGLYVSGRIHQPAGIFH